MKIGSFKIDNFSLMIVFAVVFATFFPSTGNLYDILTLVSKLGISLLFFLHGAKLSREVLFSGVMAWDRHLLVFCLTFVVFPLLSLLFKLIPSSILPSYLYKGFVFLCALPATVQSSIVFTSTAKGNISLAVCSASISSIFGVVISPFLVSVLMGGIENTFEFGINFVDSVKDISLQIVFPFLSGHILRPYIGKWVDSNSKPLKLIDQGSIVLIVYLAFCKSVSQGLWQRLGIYDFFIILVLSLFLLSLVMSLSVFLSRTLNFSTEDEVAVLFCGSKKSLVNGVPMANVMFSSSAVGIIILPLMIFHQVQLIVSAVISQKYAHRKIDKI